MKKILAMLLAVMMLLSVASVAMAEDAEPTDAPATPDYTDQQTVTIHKSYKNINDCGASPAETFTLQQVGDGTVTNGEATSAPALGTITGATYAYSGATTTGAVADITVTLPQYTNVGVYEYTLKEVAGTTAGVTYFNGNIKLVVTVINGENGKLRIAGVHTESEDAKSDTFENTYSAGVLGVEKKVEGILGDKSKDFEFSVTFTAPEGKTWAMTHSGYDDVFSILLAENEYGTIDTAHMIKTDNTITYPFKLKDGGRVAFGNLPYGVTYTVTETAVDGYTTTQTNENGTINSAEVISTFTNTKTGTIDMGVMLDSMPYVLVLAVVGAAVIALIAKKRRVED